MYATVDVDSTQVLQLDLLYVLTSEYKNVCLAIKAVS